MAGYHPGSGYPYGGSPSENLYGAAPWAPPYGTGAAPMAPPYGSAQPQPYGPPPSNSYSAAPPKSYGTAPPIPYGYSSQPSEPYAKPEKPGKPHGGGEGGLYDQPLAYGAANPFSALLPSVFPPGTDPSVVACFQIADQDGSGVIDDKELQRALSSYNQSFNIRTVKLLMYLFTSSSTGKIGPKEFISLFYSLQSWRGIFERFDHDRSGKIDEFELQEALLSLGFAVSPPVLSLLVSKFDKSGGKNRAIEYDNFIECCLTVKGLTEKFKEKDRMFTGSATFTYESFMLTVLPFLTV
ncbi:putative calcium-binding protein CML50 [Platanthera guangdongensis]|uniref:Calcium-binding protein CML50 n=1 Tax=Platanthera guangdongensis TaxID=2320717 RepID=A0ABR2LU12_9ASPA